MHVRARVHVLEHVPAGVIGVFINDKVLTAIPAPVRANRPVPFRHLEIKTAWEPKPVMVAVNSLDVIAIGRAEMFKPSVLEGVIHMVALVVRPVMPVPVIVADVLGSIQLSVCVAFRLGHSL